MEYRLAHFIGLLDTVLEADVERHDLGKLTAPSAFEASTATRIANDDESISVIHYALDQGINFLDSADMYGWGHNEQLLGRALKGRRDQAVVTTKFGQVKSADGKQGVDGRPEYVQQACEAAGLDYVSCSPYRVPIARLAAAQAALG